MESNRMNQTAKNARHAEKTHCSLCSTLRTWRPWRFNWFGTLLIMLLAALSLNAQSSNYAKPLIAYVGTYSPPLRDVLPTQVDLPPGNGRGIHLFRVDRTSGAMSPVGIFEMGSSPNCLC